MSDFVTYAENFEDVMLWRALREVGRGRYVDLGATAIAGGSATYAFYLAGWTGLNVMADGVSPAAMRAARPHDLTLDTTLSALLARGAGAAGHAWLAPHLQADAGGGIGPLHVLRIDAPGRQADILGGVDLDEWRPWFVLVRTPPDQAAMPDWDARLLACGYRRVWFDGLTCFYIAPAQAERFGVCFLAPPNPSDHWRLPGSEGAAERARARAEQERALAAAAQLAAEWGRVQAETRRDRAETRREEAEAARRQHSLASGGQALRLAAGLGETQRAEIAELRGLIEQVRALHAGQGGGQGGGHGAVPPAMPALAPPPRPVRPSRDLKARVNRVAGGDTAVAKRLLRLGIYGSVRVAARVPGAVGVGRRLERLLPSVHHWVNARYSAYRSNWLGPTPAGELRPLALLAPVGGAGGERPLSVEEQAMVRVLHLRELRA